MDTRSMIFHLLTDTHVYMSRNMYIQNGCISSSCDALLLEFVILTDNRFSC